MTSLQTTDGLSYDCAGFWLRLAAFFIDAIVLSFLNLPVTIVAVIMLASQNDHDPNGSAGMTTIGGAYLISNLISLVYYSTFECTKQATPGKMCFGLIVTGKDAKKLSFGQALARNLGKYVSSLLGGLGYLMAAFTAHKQALHDKMAGCFVLKQHHLKETAWSPTHHKHGTAWSPAHQKHGTSWHDATPQNNGSLDLSGLNRPTDSDKTTTGIQPKGGTPVSEHQPTAMQPASTAYSADGQAPVSTAEPPVIKIPDPVPTAEPPVIKIPDPVVSMIEPPDIRIPAAVSLPAAVNIGDQAVPVPAPFNISSESSNAAGEKCRHCGANLDPNFSFCLACSASRDS